MCLQKIVEKQAMLGFFFLIFQIFNGRELIVDKRQSELTPEVGRIIFYRLAYT